MNVIIEDNNIERIVFHYNKKHNEDQNIPTWIVKHKGNSYYVHHLTSSVGFSTKETPDNNHTKGSLMFRGKLKIEENDSKSEAIIS